MSACVPADAEVAMKPIDLAGLLKVELDLGQCRDLLPKEIVELANKKLSREPVDGASVKEEAIACRAAVRALPMTHWLTTLNEDGESTTIVLAKTSKPQEIVDRVLAKPPSVGGFASAVACKVLGPKAIDTKSVVWGGVHSVDGFAILRPPGAYCTTESEMSSFSKLFKTERPSDRLGDCTFLVSERSQPAPGQILMLCKSNKCNAKLAALYTPKWCVLAVYHFVDGATETETLALLEEMRIEAYPN